MAERRMGIEKVKMPLKHAILSDNQTLKKKKPPRFVQNFG